MADIECELEHYAKHFENKVVYCNCDDPEASNFFRYFHSNFEVLRLKKLIVSCYRNQSCDLFGDGTLPDKATYLEYNSDNSDIKEFVGDGDFRSDENIALLQQADIVVTNPPFSLFREYVAQLVEHDKKFLIMGNMNAITNKEIFKLIKNNKTWLGHSIHSGDREFGVPDEYPLNAASSRIDENGKKHIRVKGVRWFTNLDYKERHEDLILYKIYQGNESDYPKYDNYDAINVNKTKDIPMDYAGAIGVPISFMDKYNPEQFEIVGIDNVLVGELTGRVSRFHINQKVKYARIVIKHKKL